MTSTQQFVDSGSNPQRVDPAAVAATLGDRTPSQSPDSNATAGAAPAKSAAISQELEADPESITNIVEGDFLVKVAVGVVTVLAAFELILAFG